MSHTFAQGITCAKTENGYYDLKYITSTCPRCKLVPTLLIDNFDVPIANLPVTCLSFEQYERRRFPCIDNDANKESTRTVRVTITEPYSDFCQNIEKQRREYLLHRFECKNDDFVWPLVLANDQLGYVFHLDYSENITHTTKEEPQEAHFNGNQTSLHCTVVDDKIIVLWMTKLL